MAFRAWSNTGFSPLPLAPGLAMAWSNQQTEGERRDLTSGRESCVWPGGLSTGSVELTRVAGQERSFGRRLEVGFHAGCAIVIAFHMSQRSGFPETGDKETCDLLLDIQSS